MATWEEKQYIYEKTKDIVVPPLPRSKNSLQTKRSRIYWINQIIDAYNNAIQRHAKKNLDQYILHYLAGSYYGTGRAHAIYQIVKPFVEAVIEAYEKYRKKGAGLDIFQFFGKCVMCGNERDLDIESLCRECRSRWETFREMCKDKEEKICKSQEGLPCEYESCPLIRKIER